VGPAATKWGGEESAATGCETAMAEFKSSTEDGPVATDPHPVAAE